MFYYAHLGGYIDDFVNCKDLNEFGREMQFVEISLDEANSKKNC